MLRHTLSAAILSAALAGPASAQEAKPEADQSAGDIVVTGQRDVEPERARRFVGAVTTPIDGQLPRFHDPICPAVTGLKADAAVAIVDRLREVAAAVNVPVGAAGCEPNLIVMIAADSKEALAGLHMKGALRGLSDVERRRLDRSQGPVRAASDVELRNEDNLRPGMTTNTTLGVGGANARGQSAMGGLGVKTASLITLPTKQTTVRTILVFDAAALMGKSLVQIADHAAMWGIGGARPDPHKALGEDTILSLFEAGKTPPPSLTALDLAFLKGVYAAKPNQVARKQIQQIADRMAAER